MTITRNVDGKQMEFKLSFVELLNSYEEYVRQSAENDVGQKVDDLLEDCEISADDAAFINENIESITNKYQDRMEDVDTGWNEVVRQLIVEKLKEREA